jgi:hypothetical protein
MSNRQTIQKMLASVDDELAQLDKRRDTLLQRKATLHEWLKEEPIAQQPDLPAMTTGQAGGTPLSALLRSALADGRPHPLPDLVKVVKGKSGLVREGASPGRVIHYELIGMQQHGYVTRNEDGTWVAKKPQ